MMNESRPFIEVIYILVGASCVELHQYILYAGVCALPAINVDALVIYYEPSARRRCICKLLK